MALSKPFAAQRNDPPGANGAYLARSLSPDLPRLGGGSTLVAGLQDVMIYEKRFSIPLSECHSRLVLVFFDRFRLWLGQHVLWTAAAAYVLVEIGRASCRER